MDPIYRCDLKENYHPRNIVRRSVCGIFLLLLRLSHPKFLASYFGNFWKYDEKAFISRIFSLFFSYIQSNIFFRGRILVIEVRCFWKFDQFIFCNLWRTGTRKTLYIVLCPCYIFYHSMLTQITTTHIRLVSRI